MAKGIPLQSLAGGAGSTAALPAQPVRLNADDIFFACFFHIALAHVLLFLESMHGWRADANGIHNPPLPLLCIPWSRRQRMLLNVFLYSFVLIWGGVEQFV